jgi:CHAT domain-containing protein
MLGDGYDTVHRFKEAHWFLTHAITLMKTNPDAGFPFNAEVGDAEALNGQGKGIEAIEVLQTVLSRARTDKQYGHEANALLTLGEIELRAHELDSARENLMMAAEVSGRLRLYRILAESLTFLAKTYLLEGNSEAAEAAIHRAFVARSHLRDVYLAPVALKVAAELKTSENRLSAATSLFDKAETIIDKMALSDDTDLGRAALAGSMSDIYLEHFQLLQRQGNVARALQILERVRGRSWATRIHSTKDTPDNAKGRADLEANIASLQMQLLGTDDQNIRDELKEKLLQNERILALENNEVKRLRDRFVPASLIAIQARLRPEELLLEYVLGEPHAFCIAVTSDEARLLELPAGGGQVEALSTSYLRDLRTHRLNQALAQRIYDILLQQAESFHKERWIIAPDGVLNFLPFEALMGRDGDFIVNSQIVSYTPSATSLEISRASHKIPGRRSLLALGDIDYAARQLPERTSRAASKIPVGILRDVASLGAHLQNLPETREEVLSIAQAVGLDSKVLLGEQATESAFKAEPVSDYRIIHLAVHAISDSDFPDRSALVLAADQPPEDGFLQVREVTRLHLHADLVTLSACQTGIGPTEGEAGVISLQHAFLMSGAKAVVASLWNVEDRSTTELMEVFYRHLADHEDEALALTRAKREFVHRHLTPYYWAGFIITGDASERIH